jgi:outer membrane usher protein
VIPTRGAVVLAAYQTTVGYRVMLNIRDARGEVPPFGSLISDDDGKEVGVVGNDGQAFISGAKEQGLIRIRWGEAEGMRCDARYVLHKPIDENAQFQRAEATCANRID